MEIRKKYWPIASRLSGSLELTWIDHSATYDLPLVVRAYLETIPRQTAISVEEHIFPLLSRN